MICAANKSRKTCQQDSRRCRTPLTCSGAGPETESAIRLHRVMQAPLDIDYAGDEPIYTPEEAMSFGERALYWTVAVFAAAVIAAFVWTNWPLVAAALN